MFESAFEKQIEHLKREHRYRSLKQSSGLSFVHNDYLGLSHHPRLAEAGQWALQINCAGSRGSRLLGGHSQLFEETEEKIAAFFGSPSALFFSTGYLANLAVVTALAPFVETIFSDEKNHASLIDAVSLSRKPKQIVPHGGWAELQASTAERGLVISEALFSMDGDFVDYAALKRFCEAGDRFLLLDEAHSAGVFYDEGKGTHESWSDWSRLAVTVTFGKAFGCAGAAILCSKALREILINTARSFIYTTAPAPVVVAMVGAAIEVAKEEGWRRRELWDRAVMVREILSVVSEMPPIHDEWTRRSPIIPFFIPGEDRALRFCENMRDSGVELRAIRYPTVPKGTERIRISLNLSTSLENTELMARELVRQWQAFS